MKIVIPALAVVIVSILGAAAPAAPVPTAQQLAWQRGELTMFCHFGMNTFTDREWGEGKEDEKLFNPTALDCNQWVAAAKAGGFKMMILTAKHHDGFCLWPSAYTTHSVKASLWKDGKGDVVHEFTDACRTGGMKIGLYLSPWDRHEPQYGTPAYNDHFCNQLTELLSNYGTIDEVWFDGACGEGPNGKRQVYDWPRFYGLIRKLQPQALIAVMGPDVRWVGNESGVARVGESSVHAASKEMHGAATQVWWPAECDVSIRPGWFYHTAQDGQVKSMDQLLDIYFKSVGRNSVLLLNVPPDRRGLFADPDVQRLQEFGQRVSGLYAQNLAGGAAELLPEPLPVPAGTPGILEWKLTAPGTFNLISIREDIRRGERVRQYDLEAQIAGQWQHIGGGTVIGERNLLHFPSLTAEAVRLVIRQADQGAAVAGLGVYNVTPLGAWGSGSLTAHKPATASVTHPNGTSYGGDKAVDDDRDTRWATPDGTRECWLEVDLLGQETIGRVAISEMEPRIKSFRIEYKTDPKADWQVAYEGQKAGTHFKASFTPVNARYARLHIMDATSAPTIWEFELWAK